MGLAFVYPNYLWLLLLIPLTLALGWMGRRGVGRVRLWVGLALRAALMLGIILALAGVQLRLGSNLLTTVFVMDASDSILPAGRTYAEQVVNQAAQSMGADDRAAIVVFGEDALVERLAGRIEETIKIDSIPISTRTDIAAALQLAQALLPSQGAHRVVLLSDGQENVGSAIDQAPLLAENGVELRYVPLGDPQNQAEVFVQALVAPQEARRGQTLSLTAEVQSSAPTPASLRLFADGRLIQTLEVRLQSGLNLFRFDVPAGPDGSGATAFRRFRVQVLPEVDTRLQNNEAAAFTVVYGPPAVLLVEGAPSDGENLARALAAAKMNVTRIAPSQTPTTLPELAAYQAVILVNVNAAALPGGAMESLPVYVRDLGMGLVMVGGPEGFGAGGYLRTPIEKALPVDMDVRDKNIQSNLALVLAVDKSGSMGRCHCDNPDLNQSYTPSLSGQAKVDIAKEAIMRAAAALGNQDFLGVVAFDSAPHWVLPLAQLNEPADLENAIASFAADGQTNVQAGLAEAYKALQGVQARRKHIILLTDGWVRTGDLTALARDMQEQGITLSIVAAGEGSAEYLLALSQIGGGAYYPATNIFNVPEIFLKETVKSVGKYIVEEPFYPLPGNPSPILSGIDETRLPALLGYNGTTAKNTARLDLLTPKGDPLLAAWQYGLGRSVAWTSDMRGQWAKDWLAWNDFARFAAQLVQNVLPAPKTEGLEASVQIDEQNLRVHVSARDPQGRPLNFLEGQATLIDPDLQSTAVALQQVGAGEYEAVTPLGRPGSYLARVGVNQGDQSLGSVTLGVVAPTSPEYRSSGINLGFLETLGQKAGGGETPVESWALAAPEKAFDRSGLTSAAQAREIWMPLLLIAALLFPLDVGVRRLVFSRSERQRFAAWIDDRLLAPVRRWVRPTHQAGERPQAIDRLFEARDRVRTRRPDAVPPDAYQGDRPTPPAAPSSEAGESQPPPESSPVDALARLREAKKRAGKK